MMFFQMLCIGCFIDDSVGMYVINCVCFGNLWLVDEIIQQVFYVGCDIDFDGVQILGKGQIVLKYVVVM